MKKTIKRILILIAIVCLAGAAYYPVSYFLDMRTTTNQIEELRALKGRAAVDMTTAEPLPTAEAPDGNDIPSDANAIEDHIVNVSTLAGDAYVTPQPQEMEDIEQGAVPSDDASTAPFETTNTTKTNIETADNSENDLNDFLATNVPLIEEKGERSKEEIQGSTSAPAEVMPPEPSTSPLPYYFKSEKFFDPADILPEFKEIYALNSDFIGWLTIPDTIIDYPVVQSEVNTYYLKRDFYKNPNINGTLILDNMCDAFTPSYNLIIAGHHMRNGEMFGKLIAFKDQAYWQTHKIAEFDVLTERRTYVIFAAFYSAEYADDEPGFRYYTVFQDDEGYQDWMRQVKAEALYDTGIDVRYGDEFLTLSTCAYHRSNGRFVVIGRRLREGEYFDQNGTLRS